MNDQKPESAESTIEAIGKVAQVVVSTVVERQLLDDVQNLRAGLGIQVNSFPFAELGLRKLVGTWIDEAEQALIKYRETGVAPSIDTGVTLARAKLRYWQELLVIQKQKEYSDLPIMELHDAMSAKIDGFYPAHLQRMANERIDQQIR